MENPCKYSTYIDADGDAMRVRCKTMARQAKRIRLLCVQDHLFLFIQTFLARDNEHEANDTLALLSARPKPDGPVVRHNDGVQINRYRHHHR